MGTCSISDIASSRQLVSMAHAADEPISVYDGVDECLVAMSPAVFERILFDSDLLNWEHRELLRL